MTLDRPERLKAATPTLLEALGKRWIAPLRRPLGQTYSPETVAGSAQALTQQLRVTQSPTMSRPTILQAWRPLRRRRRRPLRRKEFQREAIDGPVFRNERAGGH